MKEMSQIFGAGMTAPPIVHARFSIGDVVKHRMFGFRGVVFDIEVPQRSFADWEMGFRAPGEDDVADMAGHRNTNSAGELRALFDRNSPAHAVMRTICEANLSKSYA